MPQIKKRYFILYQGRKVGETWAVSPQKATNNYWWINNKNCNPLTATGYKPSDYKAVEVSE